MPDLESIREGFKEAVSFLLDWKGWEAFRRSSRLTKHCKQVLNPWCTGTLCPWEQLVWVFVSVRVVLVVGKRISNEKRFLVTKEILSSDKTKRQPFGGSADWAQHGIQSPSLSSFPLCYLSVDGLYPRLKACYLALVSKPGQARFSHLFACLLACFCIKQ